MPPNAHERWCAAQAIELRRSFFAVRTDRHQIKVQAMGYVLAFRFGEQIMQKVEMRQWGNGKKLR